MKKSRFTDSQIIAVLKQAEAGTPVPELCREHGISSATFYKWRSKFGGMEVSMVARMKELEEKNRRLKKMYAEAQLSTDLLKEALAKNGEAISATGDGPISGRRRAHEHPTRLPDLRGERDLLPLPGQGQRDARRRTGPGVRAGGRLLGHPHRCRLAPCHPGEKTRSRRNAVRYFVTGIGRL